jgi:hypothetical protein
MILWSSFGFGSDFVGLRKQGETRLMIDDSIKNKNLKEKSDRSSITSVTESTIHD